MEHWYTLYTKPNAEYQVVDALQGHGIQTYLPEMEAPGARKEPRRKPFFPCYLFVKVDLEEVGLSQVRWIPGLRRIVAFDDRPTPLADEVIDVMRRKLEGISAAGGLPSYAFQPGDTVRITQGPLQGMLAVFEKPTTPTERVQILLAFLGQASRMQIPVTDLEKVPPGVEASPPAPPSRPRRTRGRGRHIKTASKHKPIQSSLEQ
jgi:transcriptional antiterminator RfaH